ncbi:MAG: preprotein translocase subunit YajC [Candidatus Omnitrophica bacterium]|nr:preprotein translocase subunit YajC [Candidatus Omnitrophota bacterium]
MFTLAAAPDVSVQGAAQQSPMMSLMPIALIFIVFYFLLIRPQKKSQQEHAKMIAGLQKNDEVVTSGGMYGTIVSVQDDVVTLRVDDNVKIKIQKGSVARLKNTAKDSSK